MHHDLSSFAHVSFPAHPWLLVLSVDIAPTTAYLKNIGKKQREPSDAAMNAAACQVETQVSQLLVEVEADKQEKIQEAERKMEEERVTRLKEAEEKLDEVLFNRIPCWFA